MKVHLWKHDTSARDGQRLSIIEDPMTRMKPKKARLKSMLKVDEMTPSDETPPRDNHHERLVKQNHENWLSTLDRTLKTSEAAYASSRRSRAPDSGWLVMDFAPADRIMRLNAIGLQQVVTDTGMETGHYFMYVKRSRRVKRRLSPVAFELNVKNLKRKAFKVIKERINRGLRFKYIFNDNVINQFARYVKSVHVEVWINRSAGHSIERLCKLRNIPCHLHDRYKHPIEHSHGLHNPNTVHKPPKHHF